jgi:hypothetical protein
LCVPEAAVRILGGGHNLLVRADIRALWLGAREALMKGIGTMA